MIRLLYFIDGLGAGGKERQIVELLKGLHQSGECEILLACTEKDDFYLPEVKKLEIPVFKLYRTFRWDLSVIFRFFFLVNKFKPQIIHTGGLVPTFYAIVVAKISGIPIVNGCIRNAFSSGGYRWKIERALLKFSDFRIANSRAGLVSRGFKESSRNVVIYNGFDFKRIEEPFVKQSSEFSFPENKKIVGMVAAFSDYKDYKTFISAAFLILAKRNDTIFITVGEGKNLDACKKMAEHKSSEILFMGRQKEVDRIIKHLTVGVLSTYTEGISNAIMEYMAAGKPVVATRGGATDEIVIDGTTGFLVPTGDPYQLAQKIELLLDDSALAQQMGAEGRAYVEQQFSLQKLTVNTLDLYKKILGT